MTIYDLAPSSPLLPLETEGDTYSPAFCSSNAPLKPYLARELTVQFETDHLSYFRNGGAIKS